MFKKIKWLYERRQYRKAMQTAVGLVRYTLPNISLHQGADLVSVVHNFIEGYRAQFGEDDGLATFFDLELRHLFLKEEKKYD